MAPGEAGKEALTGQDAPQPCLEWDIGVLQMWLWLQWVSHPQLSQSSLGWRMEPAGSQDSYRLFAGGGGDISPRGLFVGAMLRPAVDPHSHSRRNDIALLSPQRFPQSQEGNPSIRAPDFPLSTPVGGAEHPSSHPDSLHQASLPSLLGCNAGEAGAGARCPNLLRLVLFQQDFLVPTVPGEATQGWVGPQRALPRAGLEAWQRGRTLARHWAWVCGGLLATAPWGQAPARCRCSKDGGEPALSSPAGEVMLLAGEHGGCLQGVLGTTRFLRHCSFSIASGKSCKKELQKQGVPSPCPPVFGPSGC